MYLSNSHSPVIIREVLILTVLPHLQGNIEIGRHKDRNAEVGNTKHRIYQN